MVTFVVFIKNRNGNSQYKFSAASVTTDEHYYRLSDGTSIVAVFAREDVIGVWKESAGQVTSG